jgi:hypothetical protein
MMKPGHLAADSPEARGSEWFGIWDSRFSSRIPKSLSEVPEADEEHQGHGHGSILTSSKADGAMIHDVSKSAPEVSRSGCPK